MTPKLLTLKEAVKELAASPTPYTLPTLRKAIIKGYLKSEVVETSTQVYRVVSEDDLKAWVNDQSKHKIGRKKKVQT